MSTTSNASEGEEQNNYKEMTVATKNVKHLTVQRSQRFVCENEAIYCPNIRLLVATIDYLGDCLEQGSEDRAIEST